MVKIHWIIDNNAIDHIIPCLQYFSSYRTIHETYITMPNGGKVQWNVLGLLCYLMGCRIHYVFPVFHFNLLSTSGLTMQLHAKIVFTRDNCLIHTLQ